MAGNFAVGEGAEKMDARPHTLIARRLAQRGKVRPIADDRQPSLRDLRQRLYGKNLPLARN
jgi:hypothetical protein